MNAEERRKGEQAKQCEGESEKTNRLKLPPA